MAEPGWERQSRISQAIVVHPLLLAGYLYIYLRLRASLGGPLSRKIAWFFAFVCQYLVLMSVSLTITGQSERNRDSDKLDRLADIMLTIMIGSSILEYFGIS